MREDSTRAPMGPCALVPPLRESWRVQWTHVPGKLALVKDGRVFLKGSHGLLSAREEGTGVELWAHKQGSPALVVEDELLAWVGGDSLDIVECSTGRLRRSLPWPVAPDTGSVGESLICAWDEELYSGNVGSGSIQWRKPSPARMTFQGVLAADGERIVIGLGPVSIATPGARVIALSLREGREVWATDVSDLAWADVGNSRPGRVQGVLVIYRDLVIVEVMKHYIVGLSLRDGRRMWTWHLPNMAVWQGYLYNDRYHVIGGFGSYHVLDAATGKLLFETDLRRTLPKGLSKEHPHAPLLVSETHIWTGSLGPHLLAFDRETGEYAWHYSPKGGGSTAFGGAYFMSVNGRLYYGDMAFRMYCLEEENPTDPELKRQRGPCQR